MLVALKSLDVEKERYATYCSTCILTFVTPGFACHCPPLIYISRPPVWADMPHQQRTGLLCAEVCAAEGAQATALIISLLLILYGASETSPATTVGSRPYRGAALGVAVPALFGFLILLGALLLAVRPLPLTVGLPCFGRHALPARNAH